MYDARYQGKGIVLSIPEKANALVKQTEHLTVNVGYCISSVICMSGIQYHLR